MVSHKLAARILMVEMESVSQKKGKEKCKIKRSYVEKIQYSLFKVKRIHVVIVIGQGFVAVSVF